jgi:hypothetical protein
MQKFVDAARKIITDLERNWLSELNDLGFNKTFDEIYKMNVSITEANLLVAYLIYCYDPDSSRLDIRKDRYENKCQILTGIGGDITVPLFVEVLENNNETFNNVVLNYLEKITTWQWPTIFSLLDYHSNMLRFANQKTEAEKSIDKMNKEGEVKTLTQDYDIDVLAKVNKSKGELLNQAIEAREKASKLLLEIKKDFMPTDHATQSDFQFDFTDTAKEKVDIFSWRQFIKTRNERKNAIN